jgi:diacylglycerol kinase (ATP)
VLVVTNEMAGRTLREAVAAAVAVLETAGEIELVECRAPADLDAALDRRAGRTLVVVGGDGSLHAAVGRLWSRGEADQCPVGVVPLGTGNDFARGVGIPLDPMAAAELALTSRAQPVDLVTDDAGGVVVNAMHVGVGAEAAVRARPLKPYLRIASFPVGAVLAGAKTRGWNIRVEVDGRTISRGRRRILMAGLANAPSIAGGTAILAPDASVSDGAFDVVVSYAVGRLARLGYAVGLLRGTHERRADVQRFLGRTLEISGGPFQVNADGEVSEPLRRRVWTVQPGAWRCILPPPSR